MTIKQAQQNLRTTFYSETDTNEAAPVAEINRLRQDGLLGIVLPGQELDFAKKNTPQLLQLLKTVGRNNLSVGRIYEGHINALLLIHLYADEMQKERWFADAADGCLFGVWNTQANEGIEITQTDENCFVLSGKKTFGSGAGLVKRALVTGNINTPGRKGWQMCIVNMNELADSSIDYQSWKPLGMQSSVSYTVDFSNYKGAVSDLFGNADAYYKQPFFGAGAIRFCAVQLGGAEAFLNEIIAYLKSLQRTDDAYQNARIAEMATEITSGNLWLQQAAEHWDEWTAGESKNRQLIAFANMTRINIERICLRVIELGSKCVGARGLMQPYRMERIVRDLQFYLRQPAPDAALRDVANYVIQSNQSIETLWNNDDTIN